MAVARVDHGGEHHAFGSKNHEESLDKNAQEDGASRVAGRFTPVNVPGALTTSVVAVNRAGTIVGQYYKDLVNYGFVFKAGVLTTLPTGQINTTVTALAEDDTVGGWYFRTTNGNAQAFLYKKREAYSD